MKFDPKFYYQFLWDADAQLFKDPNPSKCFEKVYTLVPGQATLFDSSIINENHPVWEAYLEANSRISALTEEDEIKIVPTMGVPLFVTTCFYEEYGCNMQSIITDLNYGRLIDDDNQMTPLNVCHVIITKQIMNLVYGNFTFNNLALNFEAIPETCFDDRKVSREILVGNTSVIAVDKWNPTSNKASMLEQKLQNGWMINKTTEDQGKETEKIKRELDQFYDGCCEEDNISNMMRHQYLALMFRYFFNHEKMRFRNNFDLPDIQQCQRTRFYQNIMAFEKKNASIHPMNIIGAKIVKTMSINNKMRTNVEFNLRLLNDNITNRRKSDRILVCGTLAPTIEGPWGNYDCALTKEIFKEQYKKDEDRFKNRKKKDKNAMQFGVEPCKVIFKREEEKNHHNDENDEEGDGKKIYNVKFKDAIKHNINIIAPDCDAPIPIRVGHMRYEFIILAIYLGRLIENYREKNGLKRFVLPGLFTDMIKNIAFALVHFETKHKLSLKPGGMVKLNSFITSKRFSNSHKQEEEYRKWSKAFFKPGSVAENINEDFIKKVREKDRIPVPFYTVRGEDWFASLKPDVYLTAMVAEDYLNAVHSSAYATVGMTISLRDGEQLDVFPETKTNKTYPLHIYPKDIFCKSWTAENEITNEDIKSSIREKLEFSLKCQKRTIDDVKAEDLESTLDQYNRHVISEDIINQLYIEYKLEKKIQKDYPVELCLVKKQNKRKKTETINSENTKSIKRQRVLDDSFCNRSKINTSEKEEKETTADDDDDSEENEQIDVDSGGETGLESDDDDDDDDSNEEVENDEDIGNTMNDSDDDNDDDNIKEKEKVYLHHHQQPLSTTTTIKPSLSKNPAKKFVIRENPDSELIRKRKPLLFEKQDDMKKKKSKTVQRNMTDLEIKSVVKELLTLYKFSFPCQPKDLNNDKLGNEMATMSDKEAMCKLINNKLKKQFKL